MSGRPATESNGDVEQLGHAGLWVRDIERMRDFYSDVLGLAVTDEDLDRGLVFLSSRPNEEHHELVLAHRSKPTAGAINQLSWRVGSPDVLKRFAARFVERDVTITQTVTHGIAVGIYFLDPEGNTNEVYWPTGDVVPQPCTVDIDLEGDDDLLERSRQAVASATVTYRRSSLRS